MKRNIKLITIAIISLFLTYASIQMFVPSDIGSTQLKVQIPEGATYREAISILAENNLLRDENIFIILGKITGTDKRVRAGYYAFWGSVRPWDVFEKLKDGRIIENWVTIVEGDSLLEIGRKLESGNIMSIDKFNTLARDKDFMRYLNIEAPSLEGYLFPQTYKFPKSTEPKTVLKLKVSEMRRSFTDELMNIAKEIGWGENEVLTMASIIEKEAMVNAERPIISSVFHNRLKKGMRLQSDPTAIYGVKSFAHRITRRDLRNKTDFNTYIIHGLPPGPIASPGIKSIIAALQPADTEYLFFVARGDGRHYFSKTYADHKAAIKLVRTKQVAYR